MSDENAISRFSLYGELFFEHDPEFVHIEDISARSLLYEWRIRPHTHKGMFQLIFLCSGRTKLWLDESVSEVSAPCVMVVPSGVVHGFEFEPDTIGQVVTVADALVLSLHDRDMRTQFKSLPMKPVVVDFAHDPEQFARIDATLNQMTQEFQWQQQGRSAMLEWMFRILLTLVQRQVDLQEVQSVTRGGRLDAFTRFRHLVEDHHLEHWEVARYADALAVTLPTLNRICRQFTGKGALELIQDRLILSARRHLVYTDATVEAIAYGLGFQDPAYFSRFFKRRTGTAPGAFRQERHRDAAGISSSWVK